MIACGHLHTRSKSGNEFPAFLVCLPGNENGAGEQCENYYVWRTKRDFLLLNRSLLKHSPSTKSFFPKKAFTKLCNKASEDVGEKCGPWVRPDDGKAPTGGYLQLINNMLQKRGARTDAFLINNFDKRLKKSLIQMDSFLVASFTASEVEQSSESDQNSGHLSSVAPMTEAWSTFCRPDDSHSVVVPSELVGDIKNDKDEAVLCEEVPNAAKLGQYFASEENANDVVRTAFELLSMIDSIQYNTIFLEPSCGDGRIIEKVLQTKYDTVQRAIIGVDIDPNSIQKAEQKLGQQDDMVLKSACFLSLTPEQIFSCVSFEGKSKLIVLGGPPYTPKDLPERFILHSILTLDADIVVFILPSRCAKDAEKIQRKLNSANIKGSTFWCYNNKILDNIFFNFKETTVSQPSILQSWYKRPEFQKM